MRQSCMHAPSSVVKFTTKLRNQLVEPRFYGEKARVQGRRLGSRCGAGLAAILFGSRGQ